MTTLRDSDVRAADAFARDGFAVVPDLADADTLVELHRVYDGMIDGTIPCPGTDRELGGLTRQILRPHLHHPFFEQNPILDRTRELSKALLGIDNPEFTFSMLIYKPPGHPHATPWHQDLAYGGMPFTPAGIPMDNNAIVQFWLALDDVTETMGCMEFIPGGQTHCALPHYVISGDPEDDRRLLALDDPESHIDLSHAVKCPLKAGWATVHGYTTPHYTGPNQSSRGRKAYIFSFSNPAKLEQARREIGMAA
jgi:ectoine hydroxylase-related dioxygenase (phytanoyl-CoA dioxygenase family)